jgi:murein DD-endopeptidase MepM/ murein hydrolase activator NlpD
VKRLVSSALVALAVTGAAQGAAFVPKPDPAPTASTGAAHAVKPSRPRPAAPARPARAVQLAPTLQIAPTQIARPSSSRLLSLWQSAGAAYGIPWQVLAAINKIESNDGRNMGPSSAGAIGWMQFLPSTWLRWGIDANRDGVADPWSSTDAVYSAARYLAAAGGQTDLSRAIFAYNHAGWYVDEVLRLARAYGLGPASSPRVVFALVGIRSRVRAAGRAVGRANARYLPALARERKLAGRVRTLQRRAAAAPVLSDRLDLQRRAVLLSLRLGVARAAATRLHARLVHARRAAREATLDAGASSFDPSVARAVAAPIFDGGYAFPVGGGPETVSVGHGHHDYPAADIAAPDGSPVYALAASVVVKAWQEPTGRCGIGFTLRAGNGHEWTYCHLSFLADGVRPGAVLSAGAPVGAVGSTGDATGPHLHLQLQPATSYPQNEAWFQRFAGSAFRWQDGPVFAVVAGGS